jgi:hypothetical protein
MLLASVFRAISLQMCRIPRITGSDATPRSGARTVLIQFRAGNRCGVRRRNRITPTPGSIRPLMAGLKSALRKTSRDQTRETFMICESCGRGFRRDRLRNPKQLPLRTSYRRAPHVLDAHDL